MAQIQSRVLDLGQIMGMYAPFFQRQAEIQKANEEKLIALGALEDSVNSAPADSQLAKDYHKVMNELTEYAADISRGSHVAGYNATRTANLFRNYGKVTGQITTINKKINDSRTNRTNIEIQHPTAIFRQSNIMDNIDALANGKNIDDSFTDADTITKIMERQAEYIGTALDDRTLYKPIEETKGYTIEVLQHQGIRYEILNDIWTKGYSNLLTAEGNAFIKNFLDQAKGAIGYNTFDAEGRSKIDNVALNSLTAMLDKKKVNAIESGKKDEEQIRLQERIHKLGSSSGSNNKGSGSSRGSGRSSSNRSSRGSENNKRSSKSSGKSDGGNDGSSKPKEGNPPASKRLKI